MTGKSLAEIFDSLIAPSFSVIGHKWEKGELQVYEERRACLIMERAFNDLRRLVGEVKDSAPRAAGCTLEGDPYTLATGMCELTLREMGWKAESLGSWEPINSIEAAIKDLDLRLFWVSVSTVIERAECIEIFRKLSKAAEENNCALIVGGRGIQDAELRKDIEFSGYCDSMAQFAKLAKQFRD